MMYLPPSLFNKKQKKMRGEAEVLVSGADSSFKCQTTTLLFDPKSTTLLHPI
jgi:hypothetical protein